MPLGVTERQQIAMRKERPLSKAGKLISDVTAEAVAHIRIFPF